MCDVFLCVDGYVYMDIGALRVPRTILESLEIKLQAAVRPLCRCWKLNLGLLEEQYAVLSAEPSCQLQGYLFSFLDSLLLSPLIGSVLSFRQVALN